MPKRWQVLGNRAAGAGAAQPYEGVGVPGYLQAEFEHLEQARAFCWDRKESLGPLWIVDGLSYDGRAVEIVYGTGA